MGTGAATPKAIRTSRKVFFPASSSTYMLGVQKPVIKAHGSSKAKGIKNAIRQAKLCVANDLCGTMQSALAEVAAKAAAEKTDAE